VRSAVEEAQLTQRNPFELPRHRVALGARGARDALGGLREGRKSVIFVSQGPPSAAGKPGLSAFSIRSCKRPNRGNVTVHVFESASVWIRPVWGRRVRSRALARNRGRAIVNFNNPWDRLQQVMTDASVLPDRVLANARAE